MGQPFDIVKVRLASSTESIGAMTTAKQILANEGALAFWKGSVPPLAGVGACVSIQFGVNEAVKRAILARNNQTDLTTVQGCLAGGIAGVSNSVVSSPAEHLRIRMQV